MKKSNPLSLMFLCFCLFSLKVIASETLDAPDFPSTVTLPGPANMGTNHQVSSNNTISFTVNAQNQAGQPLNFRFTGITQTTGGGGSGGNSGFRLSNGAYSIPVDISINSRCDGNGATIPGWNSLPNDFNRTYRGRSSANSPCGESQIKVSMPNTSTYSLYAGTYEGTFSISMASESGSAVSSPLMRVTYEVPPLVIITGLRDIVLTREANGRYSSGSAFCIFNTQLAASGDTIDVYITARGNGSNGAFTMQNNGFSINYTTFVARAGHEGSLRSFNLQSGVRQELFPIRLDCNDGVNANLTVEVSADDAQKAPAGLYTGILTLEVIPK
ncbi:MAG: hypothetical protein OXC48_06195 [Endozoicomonadaceae bacterium]|nr:hypothetical protein [Endozoicomonadaceae bacterium]